MEVLGDGLLKVLMFHEVFSEQQVEMLKDMMVKKGSVSANV